ncbi:MAG: hypothetical protein M1837_006131 [Sclerophora amabilis]|nr:MAG: hypothetical protein M1837_006131 [Sclerophora amabilis]
MASDNLKGPKRTWGNIGSQSRAKKRPRLVEEWDSKVSCASVPHQPAPSSRVCESGPRRASLSSPALFEDLSPPSKSVPSKSKSNSVTSRRRSDILLGLDDITRGLRRLFCRHPSHHRSSNKDMKVNSQKMEKSGRQHNADESGSGFTRELHHRSSLAEPRPQPLKQRSYSNTILNMPASIPGGEAARAAAAEQNRRDSDSPSMLNTSDMMKRKEGETSDSEVESGIGIETKDQEISLTSTDVTKTSVVRRDPLEYMPVEIVAHILSLLDYRSLAKAEVVSKGWNGVATSHHVWREVFHHEFRGAWALPQSSLSPFELNGRGLGKKMPDQDWRKICRVRKELGQRWERGDIKYSKIEGHADSVYCVQFDEDKMITGSRDKTVRVWDMKTYKCIKVLANPNEPIPFSSTAKVDVDVSRSSSTLFHNASILCLQFDGEILVTGSSDHSCIVWSIKEDYTPVRRLQGHSLGVLDVSFDDKHIVTCSKDYTACVWDRNSGELLRLLKGHSGPVNAVQMRGDLVVSVSGDTLIKLWNLQSGACIKEFSGHTRGLACTQLSEDSHLIVSGGNDCVIRLWDATNGTNTRELHGHDSLIRSLHFDSDSGRVISGSYDQSIKVYDVKTGRLLIDFPKWTTSWILSTKADYRRIVCTSQDGKISVMDFGVGLDGVELLEA